MQIQTWEGQEQGLRYRGALCVGKSSELSLWCSVSVSGVVVLVCRYNGALVHVRQSRRWRDLSAVLDGAFMVQFCQLISKGHSVSPPLYRRTYSADHSPTSSTLSNHISSTRAHSPTRQPRNPDSIWSMCRPEIICLFPQYTFCFPCWIRSIKYTSQSLWDQLSAVLKQIGTELATRAG